MPTGTNAILLYTCFLSLIGVLLCVDLFILNRKHETISAAKALRQAAVWASLGLAFCGVIYWLYDTHAFGLGSFTPPPSQPPSLSAANPDIPPPASQSEGIPTNGTQAAVVFLQGYLLELMLSLDNMMVIGMILGYFAIPAKQQHRVLFWGIIGAVVLRGIMIAAGSKLVHSFDWIIYVFGALLLFSAYKLLFLGDEEASDFSKSRIVRLTRAVLPLTDRFDGQKFLTREAGRLVATPLLLALIVVDVADAVFAIDSIPAIFGITHDPFIVLSSNCFAILGLRAIYFAVAALVDRFKKLKVAMIVILIFIGLKMLLPGLLIVTSWGLEKTGRRWDIPHGVSETIESPYLSLGVIVGIMAGGVLWSLASKEKPASSKDAESR